MPRLVPRLSALTDSVVDDLIGLTRAHPVPAPTFVWLVGSPGAGKSSGHSIAIENGLLPADGSYVTLNLDTLLEALLPFRAASAMGFYVKTAMDTGNAPQFSSIAAYKSQKENLDLFRWYNAARPTIVANNTDAAAALNTVRTAFADLKDKEAAESLLQIMDRAMTRAIAAHVPIVYETTLSLTRKSGRVEKYDAVVARLAETPYESVIVHVTADTAAVAARIHARQTYETPYLNEPFYRPVPTKEEAVSGFIQGVATAVEALQSQYPELRVITMENPLNLSRLPAERNFNAPTYLRRLEGTYGDAQQQKGGRRNRRDTRKRRTLTKVDILASYRT